MAVQRHPVDPELRRQWRAEAIKRFMNLSLNDVRGEAIDAKTALDAALEAVKDEMRQSGAVLTLPYGEELEDYMKPLPKGEAKPYELSEMHQAESGDIFMEYFFIDPEDYPSVMEASDRYGAAVGALNQLGYSFPSGMALGRDKSSGG